MVDANVQMEIEEKVEETSDVSVAANRIEAGDVVMKQRRIACNKQYNLNNENNNNSNSRRVRRCVDKVQEQHE